MATFAAGFYAASEKTRSEHEEVRHELAELEAALSELGDSSEIRANHAAAGRVCRCGRHLAELVPAHMAREETNIYAIAAAISPELRDFTREMHRQHEHIRARLAGFCRAIESLDRRQDLDETIWKVKEGGALLIRELADHVALEENMLSGLI